MSNNQTMRDIWYREYSNARKMGGELGKEMHDSIKTRVSDYFRVCRLCSALQEAIRAPANMRHELQLRVLNAWGSKNGWSCPARPSQDWYKIANRCRHLRQRMESRGMLEKDAGNWISRVVQIEPPIDCIPRKNYRAFSVVSLDAQDAVAFAETHAIAKQWARRAYGKGWASKAFIWDEVNDCYAEQELNRAGRRKVA